MQTVNKEKLNKVFIYGIYALLLVAVAIWTISYIIRFSSFIGGTAEYRDTAFAGIINAFCDGKNPFSYEYFENSDLPGTLLDNGMIHIFPAVIICRITGLPSLQVLYFTNLLYGIVTAWLMYLIVKNTLSNRMLACVSAALSLMYLVRFGLIIGRPDVFALMCQVIIIYLVSRTDRDRIWSVSLVALLAVLTLLAKPHYCMIAAAYALYIIFGKKDAKQLLIYIGFGLFWLAVVVGLLYIFFPAHILISFERYYELFVRVEDNQLGIDRMAYLMDKWRQVIKQYLPFFLLSFVGIGFNIARKIRFGELSAIEQIALFDMILNIFTLFFTAQHTGAGLWYFYFTLIPAVNIMGILAIEKFADYRKIYVLLVLMASVWVLYRSVRLIPNEQQIHGWRDDNARAVEIVEPYLSETVYLPGVLSPIADARGIYNFDHGDDIYVPQASSVLIDSLSPFRFNETVHNHYYDYYDVIIDNVRNGRYSVIATDPLDMALPGEYRDDFFNALEENYHSIGESTHHTETVNFTITYWIPNGEGSR